METGRSGAVTHVSVTFSMISNRSKSFDRSRQSLYSKSKTTVVPANREGKAAVAPPVFSQLRQIIDPKWLIGDENDDYVAGRRGPVFHHLALGKPDEAARTEGPFVRDQTSFENIHAMAARMRVPGVDHAGGIAHQPHEHAGLRIAEQLFAKDGFADLLRDALFPGNRVRIDAKEPTGSHDRSSNLVAVLD